jgi:hypothetical protein
MEWHHMTSSRMEKLKSTLLAGKVMVTMCGMRKVLFWTACLMRQWTPTVTETLRSLYACLYWVYPAVKVSNVLLLHDNATFKCMQQRPPQILHGQCHHIHPTFLTLHNQIITCLVIWKEACEDTIMPMRKHCRMLSSSGFRERAAFTVWKYTLAQRSKMETTLKNDYVFSNDVVKFCEIFSCPICKEHEIKLGFINSDCLYTIFLPNCIDCNSLLVDFIHMRYMNGESI